MTTYVVFDNENGKILHTHSEASLVGEPSERSEEDVLALSRRVLGDRATDGLGVLRITQDVLRQEGGVDSKVYVDVDARVLRTREA
jgi:hypothetical protein